MFSLTRRLLIAVSLILTGFLGVTGFTLDQAFRSYALDSAQERLQNKVFILIALAQIHSDGSVSVPESLPFAISELPGGNLYARIKQNSGTHYWESISMGNIDIPPVTSLALPVARFAGIEDAKGIELFLLDFGVPVDLDRSDETYTFSVIELRDEYKAAVKKFRRSLLIDLFGVAIVLLVFLNIVLRWSLSPLRRAAIDIKKVERGKLEELDGDYPLELQALTANINGLLRSGKMRLERYKNSSSDLAHSLKTPLALLQGAAELEADVTKLKSIVSEQVAQINQIVSYQLQRAATTGKAPLSKPVAIKNVISKIIRSLEKVYGEKKIRSIIYMSDTVQFFGDESDLMELLGNLLDNAFKWAKTTVQISAQIQKNKTGSDQLVIMVEDDGSGVDEKLVNRVLERGVRSDGHIGGTGIGLAIANEIMQAYGGTLSVNRSSLGGANFRLVFLQR